MISEADLIVDTSSENYEIAKEAIRRVYRAGFDYRNKTVYENSQLYHNHSIIASYVYYCISVGLDKSIDYIDYYNIIYHSIFTFNYYLYYFIISTETTLYSSLSCSRNPIQSPVLHCIDTYIITLL